MKRILLLIAPILLAVGAQVWAQLPPTSNRVSPVDSAVDPPDFFSDGFVVDSFLET